MAEEHSEANRKKNILLSRGSTSVSDSNQEAGSEITFHFRAERRGIKFNVSKPF